MKIVKNKYLNAIFLLMLFSAAIHMIILAFLAARFQDLYFLNYFRILSLDYFFPNLFKSFLGNVASFIFMIFIYILILRKNKI